MNPNLTPTAKQTAQEEAIYLALIISHLNERLLHLTPGINCTFQEYSSLRREKIDLTLRLTAAKLMARGWTFVEETDSIYACHNIVLKLGGIYKQKFRA